MDTDHAAGHVAGADGQPVWFIILGVAWLAIRRRPAHLARYAEFQADLAREAETSKARELEKVQK